MYDIPRCTPQANKAIEIAVAEARHRYRRRIDTPFMLVGLVAQKDSMSTVTMRELGVNIHDLRHDLYNLIGRRVTHLDLEKMAPRAEVVFSTDVQRTLIVATHLALARGRDRPVEDEDILLSLSMIKHSLAAVLLEKYGVTTEVLEKALDTLIMTA